MPAINEGDPKAQVHTPNLGVPAQERQGSTAIFGGAGGAKNEEKTHRLLQNRPSSLGGKRERMGPPRRAAKELT